MRFTQIKLARNPKNKITIATEATEEKEKKSLSVISVSSVAKNERTKTYTLHPSCHNPAARFKLLGWDHLIVLYIHLVYW